MVQGKDRRRRTSVGRELARRLRGDMRARREPAGLQASPQGAAAVGRPPVGAPDPSCGESFLTKPPTGRMERIFARVFARASVRTKLTATGMLVTGGALLVLAAALATYDVVSFRKLHIGTFEATADALAIATVPPLMAGDAAESRRLLEALAVMPVVRHAALYAPDGTRIASWGAVGAVPDAPQEGLTGENRSSVADGRLVAQRNVISGGRRLGTLVMHGSFDAFYQQMRHVATIASAALVFTLLAVAAAANGLYRIFLGQVRNLTRVTETVMAQRDYSARVPDIGTDEMGQLAQSLNHMLAEIEARDRELERAHGELEQRVLERTRELRQEIAERRRAEQAHAAAAAELRRTMDTVHDVIYAVGTDMRITQFSRQLEAVTGLQGQALLGKPSLELFPVEERPLIAAAVQRSQRDGHAKVECRLMDQDGSARYHEFTIQPILDEHGKLSGFTGVGRDVTARRDTEAELRRLNAEIARRERERAQIMDTIHDVIYALDTEGRMIDFNRRFCEVTGLTEEQLRGKPALELFIEEDREAIATGIRQVLENGYGTAEGRVRHTDGTLTHFEYTGRLLLDEQGSVAGLTGVGRDVTARNAAEAEVRRLHAEIARRERDRAMIMNTVNDVIYALDLKGRFISFNQRLNEATGLDDASLLGKPVLELFVPEDRAIVTRAVNAVITSGYAADEARIRHVDGHETYYEFTGRPLYDDEGALIGVTGVGRDVNARRAAEEEIRRLNAGLEQRVRERTAELESANKELEAFSYSVSHDLRGPLRSIDGFSRALEEEYAALLDDTARDYLERVRRASGRMAELIDDLLRLARVGRHDMAHDRVDLTTLATRVAADLAEREPQRAVRFTAEPTPPALGDAHLLEAVLQNLIGNAWKFTARNPDPEVQFGYGENAGQMAWYVRDNGVGFDMRYATRLFQPFERLHSDRDFPGTGIGLATVARVVQRHGGRVWAQAQENAGATFYFTLGPS